MADNPLYCEFHARTGRDLPGKLEQRLVFYTRDSIGRFTSNSDTQFVPENRNATRPIGRDVLLVKLIVSEPSSRLASALTRASILYLARGGLAGAQKTDPANAGMLNNARRPIIFICHRC
jgi:hypothetical protein